ncbi:stage V sporulation protein AA [Cellulosilyticum sp. I15G10I2]|uniref:stage V sporulation protein AA n=1 Tax=Cellulosilyticum sp. I15G10I2 TaxID=1892843 RepID=UPI00085BD99D|nr:stage V sporulation protein AA [Cellulosilyticum sp. I15G10I2]
MKQHVIYIRPYKKTTIAEKSGVYIKDIADIHASSAVKNQINSLLILKIKNLNKKDKYLITIIDIIKVILNAFPDVIIQNVGDPEVLIDYVPKVPKENSLWEWTKMIIVSVIIFAGATLAIMAYMKDAALDKTFVVVNRIFTGEEVENPVWITIPYSIGIAVGIITFFNHIGKKKLTDDPSPMQVEIDQYENNVETSMIDSMIVKKRGKP